MKRKVYAATIGLDNFIIDPHQVGMLMELSQQVQRLTGYPPKLDPEGTPLCTSIIYQEIELPDEFYGAPTPPVDEYYTGLPPTEDKELEL